MPEWAFSIATNEYKCPKCGARKGEICRTPKGRKRPTPHGERVSLLRKSDWERTKGKAMSIFKSLEEFKKKVDLLKEI